jgi:hypothetical protein
MTLSSFDSNNWSTGVGVSEYKNILNSWGVYPPKAPLACIFGDSAGMNSGISGSSFLTSSFLLILIPPLV